MKSFYFVFASLLLSHAASASFQPIFNLGIGGDYIKACSDSKHTWVGAASIGMEVLLAPYLSTQVDLAYFKNNPIQLEDCQHTTLTKRLMLEGKLLTNINSHFLMHPYLLVGAGDSLNHLFAYEGGIGLEVELSRHFRFGESYRHIQIENGNSLGMNEFLFSIAWTP